MSQPADTKGQHRTRRGIAGWLPRFGLPRFGLRSLLLLIAAVATWMSYYTGQHKIAESLKAIESLHALAPELHVRDPNEYACLAIDRDDSIREYHCYLPLKGQYQINLVANQEFTMNDKVSPEFTAGIAPGEHRILLEETNDKLLVTVDDQPVFDISRKRPESTSLSWSGANEGYRQQWHPIDAPLSLLRLTQRAANAKWDAPGPGIILWIERANNRSQETTKASDQPK